MSKKIIIYVHGFRSSGSSKTALYLKENLRDFSVIANDYNFSSPQTIIKQINETIAVLRYLYSNPTIILIGTSMGGFIVNQIHNVYRILINPLLDPSKEIVKFLNIEFKNFNNETSITLTNESYNEFIELESKQFILNDYEDNASTYGLFGNNDNILNNKETFLKSYSNLIEFEGGHRLNEKIIKTILIPLIINIHNNKKKHKIFL